MKRLAIILSLAFSTSAFAWGHGGFHGGHRGGWGWVAPAIIGAGVGYGVSRVYTPPVVVQQPIYTAPPVYNQLPQAPYGYHWQEMLDPQTNQLRYVLVPN